MTMIAFDAKDSGGFDTKISSRGFELGPGRDGIGFENDAKGSRHSIIMIAFDDVEPDYTSGGQWATDRAAWNTTVDSGEDDFNWMSGGIYHVRHAPGSGALSGPDPFPDEVVLKLGSVSVKPTVDDINAIVDSCKALMPMEEPDFIFFDTSEDMGEGKVQPALDAVVAQYTIRVGGLVSAHADNTNTTAIALTYGDISGQHWLFRIQSNMDSSKDEPN